MSKKRIFLEGLAEKNTVLNGLMVISPVIVCGNTVMNALALIYVFSAITFITVMAGSFVPKKLPYGIKIIIYAVTASLVYIPARMAAEEFFPGIVQRTGVYFMLIAVNSLITVQSEAKFYRMTKGRMTVSLIFHILGFDAVMLFSSAVRELAAYGTFCGRIMDSHFLISGLGTPFGGFIFLGLLCGIYKGVCNYLRQDDNSGGDSDVHSS